MNRSTRTCATQRRSMSIHTHARTYHTIFNICSYHITLGRMGSAPSSPSLSLESTGSTPSLESPSRDSLSTIFAFFEALLSMVDMVQVLYDSLGVVVLVVSVAPCIARSPTRLVQQQQQCCLLYTSPSPRD